MKYRLNIYYNNGTKNGKPYSVAHTIDFGYDISVSFQAGAEKQLIQWDPQEQTYYILYDPTKAGMKVRQNGYLELVVGI